MDKKLGLEIAASNAIGVDPSGSGDRSPLQTNTAVKRHAGGVPKSPAKIISGYGHPALAVGFHGAAVLELHDRSMVATLKHHWLYLHSLDIITMVRRLVGFYVDQHNRVLPHSAFHGQTPDEMYFGTGEAVPADLR